MRLKIYKICFVLLTIVAVVLLGAILYKYQSRQKEEAKNQEIVEVFSNLEIPKDEEQNDIEPRITMEGYDVIGIISIPSINIEYPILNIETSNPEETKTPMKFAIVRYWGSKVNEYGNLSIAGHNNYDGTMFGKTKNLKIGEIVKLTDLKKQTIEYEIYDIFVTNPNDVSILATKDSSIREVTLITCTNGNRNRLILKAKEIIK